jgi:hypothetical protein
MPEHQNFNNHVRVEPIFISAALILLVNIIVAIVITIRTWPADRPLHLWLIVVSIALVLTVGRTRPYSLAVQDRVIRLEERLRYTQLLTPADLARTHALTLHQIVALRFASDAELPALLNRTLSENLAPKQIKQSIQSWRPDHTRI